MPFNDQNPADVTQHARNAYNNAHALGRAVLPESDGEARQRAECQLYGAEHGGRGAYGRLLRDPVAWGHMLCGGMAFASMFAYITATPFVYIEYFHVSAQHYGFLCTQHKSGSCS